MDLSRRYETVMRVTNIFLDADFVIALSPSSRGGILNRSFAWCIMSKEIILSVPFENEAEIGSAFCFHDD